MAAEQRPGEQRPGEQRPCEISVVMPFRDAEPHIRTQLRALAGQQTARSWELVAVDNGSRDGSRGVTESMRGRLPGLRLVTDDRSPSRSRARNTGVAAASGDKILFCDADDEVAPGWLETMAGALDEHDFVAARLDVDVLNEPWTIELRPRNAGLLRVGRSFLPYSFTAALGVRRRVHDAVGGFDPAVPAAEDHDYCYRIQLQGTPLVLAPGAVVHYRYRDSALAMYRQGREYGHGHAQLYARYHAVGFPRRPLWRAAGSWALLVPRGLLALRSRVAMAGWLYHTGDLVGRVEGSARHRTLLL
jgi:glycosyltransferase involved in cell wall biosynthesis